MFLTGKKGYFIRYSQLLSAVVLWFKAQAVRVQSLEDSLEVSSFVCGLFNGYGVQEEEEERKKWYIIDDWWSLLNGSLCGKKG